MSFVDLGPFGPVLSWPPQQPASLYQASQLPLLPSSSPALAAWQDGFVSPVLQKQTVKWLNISYFFLTLDLPNAKPGNLLYCRFWQNHRGSSIYSYILVKGCELVLQLPINCSKQRRTDRCKEKHLPFCALVVCSSICLSLSINSSFSRSILSFSFSACSRFFFSFSS